MKLKINEFRGIKPKVAIHLLGENDAQSAINCQLESGTVQGWRNPDIIEELSTTDTISLFQYLEGVNKHWVTSTLDLNEVRPPIANDSFERLYVTGYAQPRYFVNDIVGTPFDPTTEYQKMGIPYGSAPAFVSGHTGGSDYRAYVYCYVNRFGIEGPPSGVLSTSTYLSGNVVLGTFTEPTSGHACHTDVGANKPKVRLYRTNSAASGVAAFQFVKDTDITTATNWTTLQITDDVADADLGEVIPSVGWLMPDSNMKGLMGLSNGIFVGFYENTLYLSEPYHPEAWPTAYQRTFNENIIGLGFYGTNIIVCTDAGPYLVYGHHPSQMTKQRIPGFYPCLSKNGIVSTEHGVLYPSLEGIVLVTPNGIILTSKEILTSNTMVDYFPDSWISIYYSGKYYAFYTNGTGSSKGALVLDLVNNILTSLNNYKTAVYRSYDDSKMYVIGTKTPSATIEYIQEWQGDLYNFMQFTWKSKRILLPREINFSTARVVTDSDFYDRVLEMMAEDDYLGGLNAVLWTSDLEGSINASQINQYPLNGSTLFSLWNLEIGPWITFKLYVNSELKFTKTVSTTKAFRLPSGFRGKTFEIQIEGYVPVRELAIGTSMSEVMGNE